MKIRKLYKLALYIQVILSLYFFVFSGCKKHEEKEPITGEDLINSTAKLYCDESQKIYDAQKYVVDECDGAGFTALYAVACPYNSVDLKVFQNEEGKLFRNPKRDCYPTKSESEFSKDHVLMSMIAWHELGLIDEAKKFKDFVDKNNGVFCDAKDEITKISRCIISPTLYSLLSSITKSPSVSKIINLNANSEDLTFLKKGFEAHLHVLSIWLTGRVEGRISQIDKNFLGGYVNREPMNALFQAVGFRYGIVSREKVLAAFLNEHWPNDKLPTNEQHCEGYLWQRDMTSDKDWKPCDDKHVYTGADYSFAKYVLTIL